MEKTYDLVIVGTGTAAMTAAMRVRAAGWSVAVIDFRPFGGTCAPRGCDPKKMLVSGAEAVDFASRMRTRGVAGKLDLDWPELMAFKRGFTDPVPGKHERVYADKGIDTLHGHAWFTGRNTMRVGDGVFARRRARGSAGDHPSARRAHARALRSGPRRLADGKVPPRRNRRSHPDQS